MSFPNKYQGACAKCGDIVPAFGGEIFRNDRGAWAVKHPAESLFCRPGNTPPAQAAKPTIAIGNMSAILALFDKAKSHLKRPAIVLGVDGVGEVRLSLAGAKAKQPGTVTVAEPKPYGEAKWFGRIQRDGSYEPSRDGRLAGEAITTKLKAFAADPAKVASEHGRLTGRCCFCNLKLTDERSTATGFGKQCADNYGLAWGQRPKAFGEAA
jgi:hypothetical protein